ncbi:transposase [Aneurinibacillus tyrosinisolvens]|uniref:transposase n=1 Tax=Aneurinibacillus tyrosinisolvens TaxID=1443435 RepID=UPI00069B491B|nr:transposase [Aneurinibacillus tyrosinisolvens]
MISNFSLENFVKYPVLRHVLTFVDCLEIPETPYFTGRPGFPKKVMLKFFINKTHFGIASLRKLVSFLRNYPYWCWIAGLPSVPHLSTFSRAATWWRTEGFSLLHTAVLKRLPVDTKLVMMDSTSFVVVYMTGRQSGENPPDISGIRA